MATRAMLLTAVASALVAAGCGRKAPESKAAVNPKVLVSATDVVVASSRTLESGVPFTGELGPVEVVEVIARFDGDLATVRAKEGQAVSRGEELASYRPSDVHDALVASEAELSAAHAALLAAQNAERRAQKLLDAGAAAPRDLEAAQAQTAAAEARVRAAEAARNHAKENAERLDVPSPINGTVSKVFVHSGDRTATGDRLFTIVDNSVLELSATIPSESLGRIDVGSPIRFTVDAFPNEEFEGKIDRIGPTTEPGTRQVRIYTRIPNPEGRLVGGLFATGRVIDTVRESAVAAPLAVLRTEGERQVVYAIENGTARRIPVETGIVDEKAALIELRGNLQAGDSLLAGIAPGLRDGSPIEVIRQGPEAAGTASPSQSGASGGSRAGDAGGAR